MLIVFPVVGAGYGTLVPPMPLGTILGGFLGGAAGVVYFPISLASGMGTAVPNGDGNLAGEEIREAAIEAPWRERLSEALSKELRATEAPRCPPTAAVVRVSLLRAGTSGLWLSWHNLWSVDKAVSLFVEGEARLLRRADDRVLGKISFRLSSTANCKKILEWSLEGGKEARSYFQPAVARAASAIVAEWFPASDPGPGNDRSEKP